MKCKPMSLSSKLNAQCAKHARKIVQLLNMIRYKREQLRTLKGLQSQKRYKSPFPWYNIIADMLKKVIDNEKMNSKTILIAKHPNTSVLKSLNSDNVRNLRKREVEVRRIRPCTNATCDEVAKRSKSGCSSVKSNSTSNKTKEARSTTQTKYVPCPQTRTLRTVSKDREEDTLLNQRPTRDIESRPMGYPMTTPYTSIDLTSNNITEGHNKSYEPPFLQCPLCGWEDAKYKQIERNAVEPVMKQINFVPCSDYYRDLPRERYTPCTGCDKDIMRRSDYTKKHTDDSRDFDISKDPPKQAPYPDLSSNHPEMTAEFYHEPYHVRSIVKSKKDETTKVTKDVACVREPVQTQIVQYDPMANKLLGVTVEAYTWLKIVPSDLKKNVDGATFATQSICQSTQGVQCTKPKLYTKETQLSSKTIPSEVNDASVNTVNYVERETQNTICMPNRPKHCVSLQTLNQIDEKNKHCVTSSICTMESKEVAINTVDKVSKGIQSTICMSRGNLAPSLSFEKMKDIGTTSCFQENHNICVDATYFKKHDISLVRHVGIDVQCVSLTQLKSHESINHCIRSADLKEPMERETEEFETPCKSDTCSGNICEIIKDPTVAFSLQQILYKMLSYRLESGSQNTKASPLKISNVQADHKSTRNAKTNCRITATEMVDKVKEFTIRTLGSEATSHYKDELKQTFAIAEALSANITKPTMTEESDFKPVFESTKVIDGTERIYADDMVLLKEAKKFSSVDKEVSVYSESRDVGTNGSFSQLPVCNVGVQNDVQVEGVISMNESEMDKGKKVSVGTQKRDPILVRVIKCNESQTIVKSDKETLTAAIDIGFKNKCIDKRVETCGRSTCLPYIACRKLKEENLEPIYQKKCKCQIDSDYRQQPYKNFMCDKNCKDKPHRDQDWTDITNIDAFRNLNNSKIPLCVKARKCTYTSK
ncbi:uncharacterized protein LOC143148389 isoform X4 [Ptiloglossa arizonensis]|uniref:uncharacterized protein LOC143148389 isoform X4 n=1 Tax=Ptiloglossa arizonensis TaxID=3350558 RepID=UPI003F9FF039